MFRIYKEGGGRGGLGLEVERWEGIVREIGYDPVGLKEMSEAEKKVKNSSPVVVRCERVSLTRPVFFCRRSSLPIAPCPPVAFDTALRGPA